MGRGLGANTQSASQFVNINNIDWSSGVPVRYKLRVLPSGAATIEVSNNSTGALLATKTYVNAAAPIRLGNAVRVYAKANADLGTARVIVTTSFANGPMSPVFSLETLGNNAFSEAAQVIALPTDAAGGVQVEGTITLVWLGVMPTGSRLNVTLNLGNVVCVAPTNLRPTVVLDAPAIGTTYKTPAYPEFLATASDADGRVVKVEYFANGTKIGGAEVAPWKFKWNNAAPGQYTVRARATDDKGDFTDSVPRQITVEVHELDVPFVAVLSSIQSALAAGNVTAAASYFRKSERDKYTRILTQIAPRAPSLFVGSTTPQRSQVGDAFIEYAITRKINGIDYLFFVYFTIDEDGVWRIESM